VIEPEPHVLKMVAAIQTHELRALLAAMIARLIMLDGPALTAQQFPPLAKVWCDPVGQGRQP
jgi:hypothetical protein